MKKVMLMVLVFVACLFLSPSFVMADTLDECVSQHPQNCFQNKGGKPRKLVVICDAASGATPSKDGKSCVCEDPENRGRFFPARMVDQQSRGLEIHLVKGSCAPTKTAFLELEAKVKKLQADVDAISRNPQAKKEIAPLRQDLSNVASIDDVGKLLVAINAIADVYCPAISDKPDASLEERCRVEHDSFCKKGDKSCSTEDAPIDIDFLAGGRAGYHFRPSFITDSAFAGVEAMFTLWKGNAGAYVGGTGGWSFNTDRPRYVADARLGFAYGGMCDLKKGEHTCMLRLGGVVHSEPVIRMTNDVFGIAGELGVDFRPGGGWFGFGFAVAVGGNQVAVFEPTVRGISATEPYGALSVVAGIYPF